MDKDIFKGMDLEEKIKYINQELEQGKSLNTISEYTMSRKAIRNQFKKVNYIFDRSSNQYIEDVSIVPTAQDVTKNIQKADSPLVNRISSNVKKYDNQPKYEMESMQKADNKAMDKDLMLIVEKKEKLMKLMKLIDNYDDIMDLIKADKKQTVAQQVNDIVITLPKTGEEVRKTFRVNPIVYEEFDKFAKENTQFKIKDLVSQALKEFVNNHS